jgi:hypothetical protein
MFPDAFALPEAVAMGPDVFHSVCPLLFMVMVQLILHMLTNGLTIVSV